LQVEHGRSTSVRLTGTEATPKLPASDFTNVRRFKMDVPLRIQVEAIQVE
jgi:hypothetical protein